MHKGKIFAILSIFALLIFAQLSVSAQASDCYVASFTINNPNANAIDGLTVNFSSGDPFQGNMVLGPQIGTVGPIPANGSQSFTLSGTWVGNVPDNVVIGNNQGATYNNVSISACPPVAVPFAPVPPVPVLPGISTGTTQGFILPPSDAGSQGEFQIWIINPDSMGITAFSLTEEEFESLYELPPVNTEIASGDGWAFYVLTTGEFQINYGPTADGWYDVIVFNNAFVVTNTYRFR